jgi:chemotaxis family two-component system response regulator Rcp1
VHLLLVEDNPADARLVQEALTPFLAQGTLQFSTVASGEAALAFLQHHEPYRQAALPDLVLLDINLLGLSGTEVLLKIKQDSQLRFVPVVMFTSSGLAQEIAQCYELGASAYFLKPFGLEQFLHVVRLTIEFWSTNRFRTPKA